MRTALFVSTLLATALIGGTALADRSGDDGNKTHVVTARELKEQIQREGTVSHHENSQRTTVTSAEKAPAQVTPREKGDTYDHYGQSKTNPGQTNVRTTQSSQKMTKAPISLSPGRSHGDTVDPTSGKRATSASSNGYQATVDSTQASWTAGGKNVRSFVHSTNDKGETNNNIRGATASAMKMRNVAGVLMGTAGLALCHMSWATTGGDSMSLFPGN